MLQLSGYRTKVTFSQGASIKSGSTSYPVNGATFLQPSPAFSAPPSSLVSPSFISIKLMPSEGLVFASHAAGPGKSRKKKKKHPVLACVDWRGEHSAPGGGGGWEVFLLLELFLMPEQGGIHQGCDLWVWLGRADYDLPGGGRSRARSTWVPTCLAGVCIRLPVPL